ncbi:MAG: DUF1830 domain-containing protein [Cyanobacteria bacterium J06648_16]
MDRVRCRYTNTTAQFQILRIANATSRFLERVVFPQAQVIFEAHQTDRLEVHTGNPISSILADTIPCYRLAYLEEAAHEHVF